MIYKMEMYRRGVVGWRRLWYDGGVDCSRWLYTNVCTCIVLVSAHCLRPYLESPSCNCVIQYVVRIFRQLGLAYLRTLIFRNMSSNLVSHKQKTQNILKPVLLPNQPLRYVSSARPNATQITYRVKQF